MRNWHSATASVGSIASKVQPTGSSGHKARSAQQVLQSAQEAAWSTRSDSQLRKFLLDKGIISPSSTREELIVLARQYGASAEQGIQSGFASVSDAAQSGAASVNQAGRTAASSLSSAYYSATDLPKLAYDHAASAIDGTPP